MTGKAPFTRTDLSKLVEVGGQFRELRDVKWINPREFHRKALADIEDLGYSVGRNLTEGISIEREAIGEKTGHVESWAYAVKDIPVPGVVVWNPLKLVAIVCICLGAVLGLVALFNLRQMWILLLIGLATFGSGFFLLQYRKREPILLHGVLSLKLLANGEATERTIQRPGANVTDLFAQLTVAFACLQQYEIREHEIPNQALQQHLRAVVEGRLQAFPQLRNLSGSQRPGAFTPWPALQAPIAEFLTEDAKKLLAGQAALVGPDFSHLTSKIEQYGTGLEMTQPETPRPKSKRIMPTA